MRRERFTTELQARKRHDKAGHLSLRKADLETSTISSFTILAGCSAEHCTTYKLVSAFSSFCTTIDRLQHELASSKGHSLYTQRFILIFLERFILLPKQKLPRKPSKAHHKPQQGWLLSSCFPSKPCSCYQLGSPPQQAVPVLQTAIAHYLSHS